MFSTLYVLFEGMHGLQGLLEAWVLGTCPAIRVSSIWSILKAGQATHISINLRFELSNSLLDRLQAV